MICPICHESPCRGLMRCPSQPPAVAVQGKAVVERDGPGLLVMLPDGTVRGASSERSAELQAKAWFRAHSVPDAISVGLIEWRDGLKPPTPKGGARA